MEMSWYINISHTDHNSQKKIFEIMETIYH
jgi:hypothetical protein